MQRSLLCGILLVSSTFLVRQGDSACAGFPTIITVAETQDAGTYLLNITKAPSDHVMVEVDTVNSQPPVEASYYPKIMEYFDQQNESVVFRLALAKKLDLEALYRNLGNKEVSSINLGITCDSVRNVVRIVITSVNEFKPVFNHAPYTKNVSEKALRNDIVFELKPLVIDEDVPSTRSEFGFSKHQYEISQYDGFDYFDVHFSTGAVSLLKEVDYEALKKAESIAAPYLTLKVSVKDQNDDKAMTTNTTVKFTIVDEDDQIPRFDHPDCSVSSPSCPAPLYTAITRLDYKGVLNVEPSPIKAHDQDTLNATIAYSFVQVSDMFTIDAVTGVVTQTQSVRESGRPDSEFRLVVQATKMSASGLHDIAVLRVGVKERLPAYNGTNEELQEEDPGSKSSLMIPMIVLGVFLFLLLVGILVLGILMWRQRKKVHIHPDDQKSEPGTEEEELHTDRSSHWNDRSVSTEKLVGGDTVMPPTPQGRAGLLAPLPLKDTGTETEEPGKKKRSRRRNKNKEPEIFDGTKEYNMGADPEFFDSSDKSKVKRSHRSYDTKTDPMYWIKVPNDQPAETEERKDYI